MTATTTDEVAKLPADAVAAVREYERWRRRNRYYYAELSRLFRRHIPVKARLLEIGCEVGDFLADLQPAYAVGVDDDPALIAEARWRHPGIHFYSGSVDQVPAGEKFDYILICNVLGDTPDVQALFTSLRQFCTAETRVIVAYHNALWEPVLTLGSRIGLRRRVTGQNWLSRADLENLLALCDFQVVREFCELLLPRRVPLFNALFNRFLVKFWPLHHLALQIVMVARPLLPPFAADAAKVSVIVPTRNERGNIEDAVRRTPDMGAATELVFVDGWSTDGTQEEIARCMAAYPQRKIRFIAQEGQRGKGQAVRQGFEAATGDVLMILDADLTVLPEDLSKFLNALAEGKGEFVNGTRLVYPMEQQAMRFLNKVGNRFFSILFTWLLGQRFRDTLCGTKVLTRRNYARIAATRAELGKLDPFGDFDLIFGAARNDLKILEVPVRYGARKYGETNISRFSDGWLLLKMSWRAFWKLKLR